ncbi:RagB/SusD family nutrient uptake outer membrane protein [Catalinimonas niigatensis]|uniref:RagB/SusD family nutrient uptake outer membrane protein n=1 Tax=Catalinimonas niigatensis TaxID=1397264 RepID=UPI002665271D|nr:RagB/SusD family nutrient uptake outer membrane protein [Catalinimonas niigatensis]WPP50075.1 RagB/SusD family nutrient uptake outer membrane protein [Catalinimonas niigatensis]
MKILIKYYLIVLAVVFISCEPDLVDEPPLGPTEQTFFSNVIEFRQNLASTYAVLYDYYHYAAPSFNNNGWVTATWLLPGDDLTETNAARTSVELFDGSLNPTNTQIRFTFEASYKMIGRANVVIDKVRTVDFSNYEGASEIAQMEGEALFLRAYAYYKLFNIYGSVPIVTERIQDEANTNTPKSPAPEVLNQVIEDARMAIDILPESWDEIYAGRADKNSARGLLVKALVFRANNTGDNADYTEAISVFNSITAQLVPDFIDNFSSYTENNDESLFEVQATVPNSGNNNLVLHNDGAWRGVENMSVYRGYMMEPGDPGPFNASAVTRFLITDKLLNGFGNDPRILVFLDPEDGFDGKIFQKYNLPTGVNEITGFHGGSANNERVLRYADVKLAAAEAYLKTSNASAAIEQINDVRTRARVWGLGAGISDGTVPANYASGETDAATIMQWIMDERFVELAGEGHRYWDLKRWHIAGNINLTGWDGSDDNFSTALASPVQFDVDKHLVFPLPQEEIERNSEIVENNPGY